MSVTESELLVRTRGCGEVTEQDAARGAEVVLTGWVHRRRDLGQLIFVELRDATGLVQVVFDPTESKQAHAVAEGLRSEYVVGLRGAVVLRESPNPDHPSGKVEVRATALVVHNRADSVPIPVTDDREVNEEARLTHRYVDLRRTRLQRNLRTRHRLASAARRVLDDQKFVEVETPILTRSTPEGARDYLVPSRVHPGSFYALPQSPQLFKQLLMVAGYDRYYQFARCFRDEDLRADRQPEFTQIDIEMSFVSPEGLYAVIEPLIVELFAEIGVEVPQPFPRMSYDDAMDRYGSDRPDTRFALELKEVGAAAEGTGFKVFDAALESGGAVRGLAVPGGACASRKQLDLWTARARKSGAKGLVWIKLGDELSSPALKVLGQERCRSIAAAVGAGAGDVALVVADSREVCNRALGDLRLTVAEDLELIPDAAWNLLWIEKFPLVTWAPDEERWVACHHPFTAPIWGEVDLLDSDPGRVRSQAYDLVLNGTEIAGGSIRIHRREVQDRVFRAMRIDDQEAQTKFGFLLRALESGAPPHGGIALGFDRICALLCGASSIRDVIAFPKSTKASCLMTDAPAQVDSQQVAELGLAILESPEASEKK